MTQADWFCLSPKQVGIWGLHHLRTAGFWLTWLDTPRGVTVGSWHMALRRRSQLFLLASNLIFHWWDLSKGHSGLTRMTELPLPWFVRISMKQKRFKRHHWPHILGRPLPKPPSSQVQTSWNNTVKALKSYLWKCFSAHKAKKHPRSGFSGGNATVVCWKVIRVF